MKEALKNMPTGGATVPGVTMHVCVWEGVRVRVCMFMCVRVCVCVRFASEAIYKMTLFERKT